MTFQEFYFVMSWSGLAPDAIRAVAEALGLPTS
jgi:hypothetical protein